MTPHRQHQSHYIRIFPLIIMCIHGPIYTTSAFNTIYLPYFVPGHYSTFNLQVLYNMILSCLLITLLLTPILFIIRRYSPNPSLLPVQYFGFRALLVLRCNSIAHTESLVNTPSNSDLLLISKQLIL